MVSGNNESTFEKMDVVDMFAKLDLSHNGIIEPFEVDESLRDL